ncbi:MAG: GDP-L-fucose synthase [Holophaga sp.]|jgi:GDP-L-fucose synthase
MVLAETFPLAGRRVWVTGAHGFLGRRVTAELERRGAVVLAPASGECDLLDPGAAARFIREHRPEGAIHMAAKVGGIGANRRHPGWFFYANMAMGLHLVEACRAEGLGKLLVLGTVCAYPKFCPVPFREDDLWNGYPEETNAPYGIAKKALMVQLQAYRQEYGTRGIFLLPVNLYGPGDSLDPERNHVIPALTRKFLEARASGAPAVELWGTGSASREFLHVQDAAEAICEAMAKYEDPDPVNLGTGAEITITDLARKIQAMTGFLGELRFNPAYPDGQPKRRLDTSRALERFGWQAKIGLDQGLAETIDWMKSELGL